MEGFLENFDWFNWIVVPLLIFLSRILDVSLSTVRLMFVMTGRKKLAPLLGSVEILVWLLAITQIMQNLTNVMSYIAYAGGFAMGTYIGMMIEEKIAYGNYIVRIICRESDRLIEDLRAHNFGVTVLDGHGINGPVNVIFLVIKRKKLDDVVSMIKRYAPDAFYTVGSVKYVTQGGYLGDGGNIVTARDQSPFSMLGWFRKGK